MTRRATVRAAASCFDDYNGGFRASCSRLSGSRKFSDGLERPVTAGLSVLDGALCVDAASLLSTTGAPMLSICATAHAFSICAHA
jgi:hypothetical protein